MLKIISEKREPTPFELELNGVTHTLMMTQFSVADNFKLVDIQSSFLPKVDNKGNIDVTPELTEKLMASRLKVSIKNPDGSMFFTGSVDEILDTLGAKAVSLLCYECDKLNPMDLGGLEDKKK